jgi:hypothetical protein
MARKTGKSPLARGECAATHRRRVQRLEKFELAGLKYVQRWPVRNHITQLTALRAMMLKTVGKYSATVNLFSKSIRTVKSKLKI